ncbi:hypothetical protein ACQEVB_17975 [Pseudonocardia sp. CA-107938]|uniref:hypothetical protein n=1 Tax=Pseudonocardia sp. CA-107938 TaxID=3240021 RepID=UPI003D916D45
MTIRRFVVDYLQMLAAMVAGTVVLAPLTQVGHHSGTAAGALLMASTMFAGAAAWQFVRGHGGAAIAATAVATYGPFVALFPLVWLGVLDTDGLMVLGHVLMLPSMAVTMLQRGRECAGR